MSDTNPSPETSLQEMAHDIIQQAIDLLHLVKNEQYTKVSSVMPGGTIGKHMRHLYDHFRLLYAEHDPIPENWIVDYDTRARNDPSESDRLIAIDRFAELQNTIKEHTISLQTPLTLSATITASDHNKYQFTSSFGRELFYCCIHAIHHYASIKSICVEQDITTPKEFGVAPSTLQDQQKNQ
ncbi:uncharacterized protein B0P05DRAFT_562530 [Gilbertella persicaria]|uniref:uncharacterized protein n=1 Tax=Gilbertella persicaria TaxID=101096 RepID=UPI00221F669B|nr:uncharacterized protein B0P05DRAFT_562530 [Gilbertella persicaria]KAI8051381.1 hypothetical protein B0P05DRAFT_562530 [Gilbertella persicaria]